jgi:hypothetical protein
VTTLFVGAGYTGARVLKRLPDAVALGRSRSGDERLDLDHDERLRVELPEEYAVIYSIPPAPDQPGDPRFARFSSRYYRTRRPGSSTSARRASTAIATAHAWTRPANRFLNPRVQSTRGRDQRTAS